MSEKIVALHTLQYCDICGKRIDIGEECRLVRDDFLPFIVFFEHIRCPDAAPAEHPVSSSSSKAAELS